MAESIDITVTYAVPFTVERALAVADAVADAVERAWAPHHQAGGSAPEYPFKLTELRRQLEDEDWGRPWEEDPTRPDTRWFESVFTFFDAFPPPALVNVDLGMSRSVPRRPGEARAFRFGLGASDNVRYDVLSEWEEGGAVPFEAYEEEVLVTGRERLLRFLGLAEAAARVHPVEGVRLYNVGGYLEVLELEPRAAHDLAAPYRALCP